jgi:hypothetical protein
VVGGGALSQLRVGSGWGRVWWRMKRWRGAVLEGGRPEGDTLGEGDRRWSCGGGIFLADFCEGDTGGEGDTVFRGGMGEPGAGGLEQGVGVAGLVC